VIQCLAGLIARCARDYRQLRVLVHSDSHDFACFDIRETSVLDFDGRNLTARHIAVDKADWIRTDANRAGLSCLCNEKSFEDCSSTAINRRSSPASEDNCVVPHEMDWSR
jgi:hypothetical protein